MVKEENIISTVELDPVSSAILNAMDAHIAILNTEGEIIAFNKKWKNYIDEQQESWSHPDLEASILKSLQAPLAGGNDFALRLLLGIKEVLSSERKSFEVKIPHSEKEQKTWFKTTVKSLGREEGALLIYEDISSHVVNQSYLRETQEKFEKHFHNSLYGILIADEHNVVIEANNVACKMLETTNTDITYSSLRNFIDTSLDTAAIQKRINREGSFVEEREITTSNGKKIPVELSVTLFRKEDGNSITSWAFKDISDKKIIEKALKVSDKQYKLQFNNTLEGTIIGRPNGLILEVNPSACDMLGYKADELKGQQRNIVFDSEHPINKKALEKRRTAGSFMGEVEFTHKSGRKIPVEVSSVIFKGEDGSEKTIINIKDISSRKAIQRQLIQEKEFTESAISSLPTAFLVFNTKGEMIRWNNILEQELGYTNIEISKMNVMNLVHPEDRYTLQSILGGELSGKQVKIETRCITKSGKILHYLIRGTSFLQNGERYIVAGGLNRNDFKKVESEKRKNEELLSQLFDNSPVGFVLVDVNGKIKNVNKSFEEIFGYANGEIVDKELNKIIVPDYMDEQAKAFSHLSFIGDSFQSESIRVAKDGTEIPVLIGGVPVEVDGEIIAIYGMYIDISERKALENQIVALLETEKKARLHMQDMFEEAPSAIAMLEGEDHRYTFTNDTYKKLVRKDDLLDKPVSKVLPELMDQGFIEILNTCYSKGKSFQFNERKVYFNNGSKDNPNVHYLNFMIKSLRDESDNIYGIFIEAVDVTEQVEARNIIEKSLAEKDTLLAEVHHRVKNNLAIISGLLELEMMATEDIALNKHLNSTQSRITSIAKIHELLYKNESLTHVNFKNYIESVLESENKKTSQVFEAYDLNDVILNVNQAIPAGMLLNEIISCLNDINKKEYGEESLKLNFSLRDNEECVAIELKETGRNLFKFFNNSDNNTADLRMELVDVLLRQIHGELTIKNKKQGLLTIHFAKREVRGPHNALKN